MNKNKIEIFFLLNSPQIDFLHQLTGGYFPPVRMTIGGASRGSDSKVIDPGHSILSERRLQLPIDYLKAPVRLFKYPVV